MSGKRLTFIACMVAATALFGAGSVWLKLSFVELGPLWTTVLRFGIAAICFLPFLVAWKPAAPLWSWRMMPSAVCMAGVFLSAALAVNFTTATTAGFFFALPMLFAPAFAWISMRRKYGVRTVILQAIVIFGLYLLCCGGGTPSFGLGEFMGLCASAFYAAAVVLGERVLQDIDPMGLTAGQLMVTFVLSLGVALALEPMPDYGSLAPSTWATVVALGAFATCLASVLQNIALKRISATIVAFITSTEPVFTAVFAYFLLAESMNMVGWVGAAIIVGGTMIASLPEDARLAKPR